MGTLTLGKKKRKGRRDRKLDRIGQGKASQPLLTTQAEGEEHELEEPDEGERRVETQPEEILSGNEMVREEGLKEESTAHA